MSRTERMIEELFNAAEEESYDAPSSIRFLIDATEECLAASDETGMGDDRQFRSDLFAVAIVMRSILDHLGINAVLPGDDVCRGSDFYGEMMEAPEDGDKLLRLLKTFNLEIERVHFKSPPEHKIYVTVWGVAFVLALKHHGHDLPVGVLACGGDPDGPSTLH